MKEEAEIWSKKGLEYMDNREYKGAIWSLSKAIEINPDLGEAWFRLGVVYFQREEFEKALVCHLKVWYINPELRGIEHDIITCYDKLVEIKSKDFNTWRLIGDFYFLKGVYKLAVECYDKALAIGKPSKSSVKLNMIWTNKGIAHTYLEQLDLALNCYDKALEIDPADIIAQKNKVKIINKRKKKCSKCGMPLNLTVGQLLGKKLFVIVETDDLRYLMNKVKIDLGSEPSYDNENFKKLEVKYENIKDDY